MKVLYNSLHKKATSADSKCAGLSRKMIGEASSSTTYSDINESASKRRKRCVDHPKDISKLICLICGPGNSSNECKILGDFVTSYAKVGTNKDCSHDPATKERFILNKENNNAIQHAVDEIIPQDNERKL